MKRVLVWICFLLFLLPITVGAEETPIEIRTPEDLAAMAERPEASYILMNDLDLSGIAWQGIDFQGTLDGNGYSILNLSPQVPGAESPVCYDGNFRTYEPEYYGLFATLKQATVKNLSLLNVRTVVQTDAPCYLAGLSGYCEESTISDCTVTGNLELRAHEKMIGVAGLVGYGNGTVENCRMDITLICVDTDAKTRDEQFLGGIYGHGFFHVRDCTVAIDGYASEHGYCHNGGIGGMHMRYPLTHRDTCEFTGNTVNGKITFFEDNYDRRAYCDAYIGEYLEKNYRELGNTREFIRDEKWQYKEELRPCMCEGSPYQEVVTEPDCKQFGYTTYTCDGCGYSYQDHYRVKTHTPGPWQITKEPTANMPGEQTATCTGCEYQFSEQLEPLPTEATQPQQPMQETVPKEQPEKKTGGQAGNLLIPVAVAALWGVLMILRYRPDHKKGKFQN